MAQANRESGDNKKNQTSEDFSLVQAGSVDSILKNTSWPRHDDSSSISSGTNRSLPTEETVESNQIYASHYALSTAYTRVTKKLAAAEQRNQKLMMQDSLRGQDSFRSAKMSGSPVSQTNFAMPPDMEASINQAWEAYNEKCKECQQLREELEEVKQRNNNAEHHSRLKNLREDVLREKAKQGDVVRRLERTKMEADHLEKKEILAREELEKEREYLRSIIQSAEKKHREMEQRIEELERSLAKEKCLTEDLRKRDGNRQKILEDEFHSKKETFIEKINELEGRNIHLKEEVSVLLSMQSANFNGPALGPQINGIVDGTQAAGSVAEFNSDKDIAALEQDIQSLKLELCDLKARTSEQCSILSAVLQNPKTVTLLGSIDYFQENAGALPSVEKCNRAELVHKRKKTNSPRLRNHAGNIYIDGHSVDSTSSSLQDIYGPSTANIEQFPSSRQIPEKYSDDTSALPVPIKKHAEDIIRDISNEGTMQHRKVAKPTFGDENLFSPMDVSRVIHTSESSGPRTTPANGRNSSENFSDDSIPGSTTLQSVKYLNTRPALTTGSQPPPYYNGNGTTGIGPQINGQAPPTMQNSLPTTEIKSNQFCSAMSSNSISSTDASTTTTNPVYEDLTSGRTSSPTTTNRAQATMAMTQNLNRSGKQAGTTTKHVMDLDNEDLVRLPKLPQSASNLVTPGNRYVLLSDEESDSDSLQQISQQETGPREFVVPKVVRAEDLATAQATSNRNTFLDSVYSAPQVHSQTRPATRAKAESPSHQSDAWATRPEASGSIPATHQHPSSSNRTKKNQEDDRWCPICDFAFSSDWTEEKMARHINGHFSDEDNNVLSFD